MGLLDKISQALKLNKSSESISGTPFRDLCAASIDRRLEEAHLRGEFSSGAIERLSAWLWQECLNIEAHPNPRARCRFVLVDQTLMRSKFEVLIMEPEIEKDVTGLVGTQGVVPDIRHSRGQ